MTFAADSLLTFAHQSEKFLKALRAMEFTSHQLDELLRADTDKGMGARQRVLRDHFRSGTKALFDTPFFIRPQETHWGMWFIHLSRHAKARDVMIGTHWEVKNVFVHFGTGGFQMLGYDALLDTGETPLFNFGKMDRINMFKDLENTIPQELYNILSLSGSGAINVHTIHQMWANKTAASFSDIDELLTQFVKEGEFDLLRKDGKEKDRGRIVTVRPTDLIVLPTTLQLPGFSRIDPSRKT